MPAPAGETVACLRNAIASPADVRMEKGLHQASETNSALGLRLKRDSLGFRNYARL